MQNLRNTHGSTPVLLNMFYASLLDLIQMQALGCLEMGFLNHLQEGPNEIGIYTHVQGNPLG